MINTLLGTKKSMTSSYDARGRRVGATVVFIEPNVVTQIKSSDGKDGYDGVQLAFGSKKSTKKPQIGHAKKSGLERKVRFFREVRIGNQKSNIKDKQSLPKGQMENSAEGLEPGQEINLRQVFSVGDVVKVTGTSKGKGFQGVVRRHGFHGGPKTHGQSDRHRAPGSIGQGTTPGRVYKGKKMAGHMGNVTVSYKNLEVIGVDKVNNLLTIKGGVPGFVGGLVIVEKIGKVKGYTPPPEEKEDEPDSAEATPDKEEEKQATDNSEQGSDDFQKAEETKNDEGAGEKEAEKVADAVK